MQIYAGSINRNHMHMLISIPPKLIVSQAVQYLKGKSSHRLLTEFLRLKKNTGANISGREVPGWCQLAT